jgi:trehalose 6-phosphate phosphatase
MVDGDPSPALSPPPRPSCTTLALFLDLDGTLVDFAATPQAVSVDATMRALLVELWAGTGGALALVSGRSLDALDRLLAPLVFDGAGIHGSEWRSGGVRGALLPPPPEFVRVVADLTTFAAVHPGVLVEDKGQAVAVHTRLAPHLAASALAAVQAGLARLGERYRLQRGSAVLELVPAAASKGVGIARLMASPPFAGRRPVFAGDDLTDESGFAVVRDLGGFGILIGPARVTAARFRLPSVAAFRGWLIRLAGKDGQHFFPGEDL